MINNDSVVTAYDEHLTLVEWLQKVEVLLKNGGLKSVTLNDNGSQYNKALFSLTLTFNDGTKIETNAMSLKSVNEALNNIRGDVDTNTHRIDDLEDEVDGPIKYKGYDLITYDKTNCVRVGNNFATNFDTEEMTLKYTDSGTEITLSTDDAKAVREIILKAVHYGFIVEQSNDSYMITSLEHLIYNDTDIDAIFIGLSSGLVIYRLRLVEGNKLMVLKTNG